MFRRCIPLTFLLTLSLLPLYGEWLNPLPTEFKIKQHWFSASSDFDIVVSNKTIATVHRTIWLMPYQYNFNIGQDLMAQANGPWHSSTGDYEMRDSQKKVIGKVVETTSFFGPYRYEIRSSSNQVLAIMSLSDGTNFVLRDPSTSAEIAKLTRPWIGKGINDDWTVKITNRSLWDKNGIDSRFVILIAAYQSDSDQERWEESKNSTYAIRGFTHLSQLDLRRAALKDSLEYYAPVFQDESFSDDDVEAVVQLSDDFLQDIDRSDLKVAKIDAGEQLIAFFEGDVLSQSQKSALFHMMDSSLNSK